MATAIALNSFIQWLRFAWKLEPSILNIGVFIFGNFLCSAVLGMAIYFDFQVLRVLALFLR